MFRWHWKYPPEKFNLSKVMVKLTRILVIQSLDKIGLKRHFGPLHHNLSNLVRNYILCNIFLLFLENGTQWINSDEIIHG